MLKNHIYMFGCVYFDIFTRKTRDDCLLKTSLISVYKFPPITEQDFS